MAGVTALLLLPVLVALAALIAAATSAAASLEVRHHPPVVCMSPLIITAMRVCWPPPHACSPPSRNPAAWPVIALPRRTQASLLVAAVHHAQRTLHLKLATHRQLDRALYWGDDERLHRVLLKMYRGRSRRRAQGLK
jgi:hypothetical protein